MAGIPCGKYVLKSPASYHISEEDGARVREECERWLKGDHAVAVLPPGCELVPLVSMDKVLDRLAWVLGLSTGERSFIQHLADNPRDGETFGVFCDWLKEQGRQADAERLQQVHAASVLGD